MRNWSRLVQVTHSIPKKLKPCVNTSLLMERYKNNEKTCTSSNHALESKVLFSTRLPLHLKWGNKYILMCVHKLVSCTHYVFILVCRHSMSKPIRLQCIMFCAWKVSHNFLKKLSHQVRQQKMSQPWKRPICKSPSSVTTPWVICLIILAGKPTQNTKLTLNEHIWIKISRTGTTIRASGCRFSWCWPQQQQQRMRLLRRLCSPTCLLCSLLCSSITLIQKPQTPLQQNLPPLHWIRY